MVETRFQTSFIPKKPLATSGVAYRRDAGGMGFFSVIATIVFIIAALLSLGIFFYSTFLTTSIASKEEELTGVLEDLNRAELNKFINLGNKAGSARILLSRHISFSRVTDFFESLTLRNVRYESFTFEATPGNLAKISLKGEAQSYAAVSSQASVLSRHDGVSAVSFGALALDEKGTVTFDSVISLKPEAYVYRVGLDELTIGSLTE